MRKEEEGGGRRRRDEGGGRRRKEEEDGGRERGNTPILASGHADTARRQGARRRTQNRGRFLDPFLVCLACHPTAPV